MPIYAYKCESCGFAKDVLQKMSDTPLQDCPACAKPTFKKQVTAAGFQLKGSGWYATDFKGGPASTPAPSSDGEKSTADTAPAATAPAATDAAPAQASPSAAPAAPSA